MINLAVAVPPPPPRKRRGDSYNKGLRTVRNGIIRWHGHNFVICSTPLDPHYDGHYEGLRFVVTSRYEGYGNGPQGYQQFEALILVRPYDGPIHAGIPFTHWRRWVRVDVFDD